MFTSNVVPLEGSGAADAAPAPATALTGASAPVCGAIRVLLADHRPVVRAGLREVLRREQVEIVGESRSAEEALAAGELAPASMLIDAHTTASSTIRNATAAGFSIIAITAEEDDELLLEVLRAGAAGVIRLDAEAAEILQALREVADGLVHLDVHAKQLLLSAYRSCTRCAPVR